MNVEQLLGKCGFPPGAAAGHLGAGWSVKFLVSDHSLHVLTSDFELVFSVAAIATARERDTVLATDELPPGRGEDGHHYRDDELPSSRHPLYANNERQHQLQMVQS